MENIGTIRINQPASVSMSGYSFATVDDGRTPAQQAAASIADASTFLEETVLLLRKRLDHVLRAEGPTVADIESPAPSADSEHTAELRHRARDLVLVRFLIEDILERLDI